MTAAMAIVARCAARSAMGHADTLDIVRATFPGEQFDDESIPGFGFAIGLAATYAAAGNRHEIRSAALTLRDRLTTREAGVFDFLIRDLRQAAV